MLREGVRIGTGAPPARRQGLVLFMAWFRKANAPRCRCDQWPVTAVSRLRHGAVMALSWGCHDQVISDAGPLPIPSRPSRNDQDDHDA